ncbi:uncharacterized protein [Onthophagus taurus]|uniref:uncharacterized protein isoform X1 n=1 Tax=Onthophagus taurus TaxID=166361 RepID=UPI0039BDED0D
MENNPDEPLNLTVKKCPIAIVSPILMASSDKHLNKITNNATDHHHHNEDVDIILRKLQQPPPPDELLLHYEDSSEDIPQDLSIKKNGDEPPLSPSPNRKPINNEKNYTGNYLINGGNDDDDGNEKLFFSSFKDNYRKNDFADNLLKNSIDLKSNLFRDVYKMTDFYDNLANKNLTPSENVYLNVLNHLTEQKFLAALYVNSFLSSMQHHQPQNVQETYERPSNRRNSNTIPTERNSPTKNSILNNLLNKKPPSSARSNFELIKNETNSQEDSKSSIRTQADQKNNMDSKNNLDSNNAADKKKPHIKKPLNAFMLYMKEMRAKVVAECTLKESAAINQILGRKWHSLSREEQAKYYEKARQERQLHMQLYPGWSARDNYGYGTKKKKRKKERTPVESGGNSMKKCRARYGLDQQNQWCKPCRRKKKCIRYMEAGDHNDGNQSDDNLGSCGSMGEAHTPPDDDTESLNQSISSPGGLSALSSLTSPGGVVLPSPSTSVASPSVSVSSPYMLQSPLTPHEPTYDKLPTAPPPPIHQVVVAAPPRNPVGTNPHDINNPLSVNQLTGQCVKNEPPDTNGKDSTTKTSTAAATAPPRSIISVT